MKEYSKSSLRKHLRTELLSQRRAAMRRRDPRAGPAPRRAPRGASVTNEGDENSLSLIRREFAIAKKLDHPNIVTLVEVLDYPHGDSLYLILEWCEKGPVMPTNATTTTTTRNSNNNVPNSTCNPQGSLETDKNHNNNKNTNKNVIKSSSRDNNGNTSLLRPLASPSLLSEEQCRLYFRDMILGIEYLHSQGVIHRDIKADNLLLDEDDVLKIADFGVSELFEQDNDIITKTAGSPAYMAPELAVISNGTLMDLAATKDIPINSLSGRSADIWSMGVTLYYMVFGILPFRADTVMDLFTKIVVDEVEFPVDDFNPDLKDLLLKILCKSPHKRIKMDALRRHPWVTHRNEDPLISKEENISDSITPVTEEDIQSAIERVRGLGVEPQQAIAKLRRLHGWRGQPSSSTSSSRSPSISPCLVPNELGRVPSPSPLDDNSSSISVHKLTRALEEVVQRNHTKNHRVSSLTMGFSTSGTQPTTSVGNYPYGYNNNINSYEHHHYHSSSTSSATGYNPTTPNMGGDTSYYHNYHHMYHNSNSSISSIENQSDSVYSSSSSPPSSNRMDYRNTPLHISQALDGTLEPALSPTCRGNNSSGEMVATLTAAHSKVYDQSQSLSQSQSQTQTQTHDQSPPIGFVSLAEPFSCFPNEVTNTLSFCEGHEEQEKQQQQAYLTSETCLPAVTLPLSPSSSPPPLSPPSSALSQGNNGCQRPSATISFASSNCSPCLLDQEPSLSLQHPNKDTTINNNITTTITNKHKNSCCINPTINNINMNNSIECINPNNENDTRMTRQESDLHLSQSPPQQQQQQQQPSSSFASLGRKPSKSRARALLGLESLTSFRTRSVDTDTRV